MQIEFNPGHSQTLENIGILKPGEHTISVEALVQRTVAGDSAIIISVLDQQVMHITQNFMFFDSKLERAKKQALTDQAAVDEARNSLLELATKIASLSRNAEAMRSYVTALYSVEGMTLTDKVKRGLGRIENDSEFLLRESQNRQQTIQKHLGSL